MTLPPLTHPAGAPTAVTTSTTTRANQPRIAVVGGSLTGCATALLLLHAGFTQVAIHETAPGAAPRGGGLIGLEHPTLNILDRLGIDQSEFVAHDFETVCQATTPTSTGTTPSETTPPPAPSTRQPTCVRPPRPGTGPRRPRPLAHPPPQGPGHTARDWQRASTT